MLLFFMKIIYFIATMASIFSCNTPAYLKKYDLQKLEIGKNYEVQAKSFKSLNDKGKLDPNFEKDNIQNCFSQINKYDNKIKFQVINTHNVQLIGLDSLNKNDTIYLKGKFRKNYFYCKLVKHNIVLPPIYISRNMDKYYIAINKNEELLLHHYYINEGMIFILGAGNSFDHTLFFKPIKKAN